MNQEHFLTEFKIHLAPLSEKQRTYLLQVYQDKFAAGLADGKSEIEISLELGNPKELAAEILNQLGVKQQEQATESFEADDWQEFTYQQEDSSNNYYPPTYNRPVKQSGFVRLCQVVGILALNFLFMLWILLAGVLLLLAVWLLDIIMISGPLFGLFSFFMVSGGVAYFNFFFGILLGGIGLIGLPILLFISKYTWKFIQLYGRWNLTILRGNH